jgi:uncharacterized protein
MKFSRDQSSARMIRHVEPGRIVIGDDEFSTDFAVTADGQVSDLIPPEIPVLREEQLQTLLLTEPEMIIVGSGWQTAFPPRELVFAMARRGIGIEVMGTPAACRTYNILVNEGRRPAAIFKVR